jgi:hypothetical protein
MTTAPVVLPGDRDRVADRERELADLDWLLRERGRQRPPPEPTPLHRSPSSPARTRP